MYEIKLNYLELYVVVFPDMLIRNSEMQVCAQRKQSTWLNLTKTKKLESVRLTYIRLAVVFVSKQKRNLDVCAEI